MSPREKNPVDVQPDPLVEIDVGQGADPADRDGQAVAVISRIDLEIGHQLLDLVQALNLRGAEQLLSERRDGHGRLLHELRPPPGVGHDLLHPASLER